MLCSQCCLGFPFYLHYIIDINMQNIWSEENPHAIQKVLLHSVQQIIHFGTLKCVEKLVYML